MLYRLKSSAWILIPLIAGSLLLGCERGPVEIGKTEYKNPVASQNCGPGMRTGKVGASDDEITPNGIKFNVRTPSNYDSSVPHPLIVVYAPAGRSRFSNERMTGLTFAATRAGYIIAYPDHQRISAKALIELAGIPGQISGKWCIDENRIYMTGHSDGGTVTMGLGFLEDTRHIPDAIAPSGSGIRGSDLAAYPCPEPISVLIMHSKNDRLFPGFGQEAAEWWANCNRCAKLREPVNVQGCFEYPNCGSNVKTWYCEGEAPHEEWSALNSTILDFFTEPHRVRSRI
ncbi:MAG: poly(3-hydroxybutyrate) depolymerase [Methylococcaceae bacterium]|nr:poly(3-hydroxybutyrate) depolymerase [Methylococcaceae bacterium]